MTTKKQFLEEAAHYLGDYNPLSKLHKPTKKMLKETAIEVGIEADIQERVVLKRALRVKKVDFDESLPTCELVQLAKSARVNFNRLEY